MVYIKQNKLIIEIETESPHEDLHLFNTDLLQILLDSNECYIKHDPKLSLYTLLRQMAPNTLQLQKGVSII